MMETELWVPNPEKSGYLKYAGQRPISEIKAEIDGVLKQEVHDDPNDGKIQLQDVLDYGMDLSRDDEGLYPVVIPRGRWIACFAVPGSNEGDYIHVEVIGGKTPRQLIFIGKTFHGLDAALAVAGSLTRLFHGPQPTDAIIIES